MRSRRASAAATIVALFVVGPSSAGGTPAGESAMAVLDAFMAAFNDRDVRAFEAQLHFPHYRFAGGTVSRIAGPGTRPDFFERFASATPGWDHSAWEEREVVQEGPSKVHVATRFVRYRADGSMLSSFDSLYIVTREGGRWGIKARSSFAP